MVRTAYKALAAALLKSLNMRVSEAKGGGHGLLASPLDTPLALTCKAVKGSVMQVGSVQGDLIPKWLVVNE